MLWHQMMLIQQNYDFLKCRIEENILICTGWIVSNDYKNKYKFQLRCVSGAEPKSIILEPSNVEPCTAIHMYEDHSLCLHYPPDMKWSGWTHIYQYTIPWIVEWVHYYEIYLINGGIWEGRQSPVHFTEADKNIEEDFELHFGYDKI